MKNPVLLALACILLVGCGVTRYNHSYYPEHEKEQLFARDNNQCEAYSRGLAPMPEGYKVKTPTTTYGTGSTVIDGQRYNYTYTATTTPNAYVEAGNAMQGLGSQMAALATQQRAYEMCMNSLGWFEVEKKAENTARDEVNTDQIIIHKCLKDEITVVYAGSNDIGVDDLARQAEQICLKKTGLKINNLARYYAGEYIDKKITGDVNE